MDAPHRRDAEPIDWGSLRRLSPVDADFGLGRGKPVDRHYIEGFLDRHRGDIRGRVLEVGSADYTRRFGGSAVSHNDVLHVDPGHPGATLCADLAVPETLPQAAFDCFICTQTLTYVYDLARAAEAIRRLLAPGGVLLATVPGISQISPYDRTHFGEYWRFTAQSLRRVLSGAFDPGAVAVEAHGNVLAATAFLQGAACEDLDAAELDHVDDRYELVVTARAVKTRS